jgi:hypothetical protein
VVAEVRLAFAITHRQVKEATRPIADDVLVGDDGGHNLIGPAARKIEEEAGP